MTISLGPSATLRNNSVNEGHGGEKMMSYCGLGHLDLEVYEREKWQRNKEVGGTL